MNGKFKNKVGLVTGAGAGIGKATAIEAAKKGADVVVCDINEKQVQNTAEQIREHGVRAISTGTDVSDASSVDALFDKIEFEVEKLDFAFNNAGIEGPQGRPDEVDYSDWKKTLDVNLDGTWLCMRKEIEMMLETGGGSIVNMSSIAGLKGFQGLSTYTASKHAVLGLTRAAALDYAEDQIRINAICPGVIDTEMIDRVSGGQQEAKRQFMEMEPMGRLGTPNEIADAVLWLASDESSFVTGEHLVADGGIMAG